MNCTKSVIVLFAVTACLLSGCAMCANPFDECYAAFGGSRPRADMLAGRVGSLFAEAGQWTESDPTTPMPVVVDEGTTIDDQYESEVIQDESYGDRSFGNSYEGSTTRNNADLSPSSQLDEVMENIIEETR